MSSHAPFAVNIIPPSPEASALAKYADIPVSLYTGTPEISIPLYEIRERDIVLPISLNYHASGHKVENDAPRVGLGWSLNAGGIITRSVRGLPDEYGPEGFLHQAAIAGNYQNFLSGSADELYRKYDRMARGCLCVEPDIYFFNFAGYSGSFQFDWDGSIIIGSSTKLRITAIGLNPNDDSFIQGWEIITPDGLRWLFDVKETTTSRYDPLDVLQNPCAAILNRLEPPHTWHLTEVSSPFTNSNIRFDYTDYFQTTERWLVESQIHNQHLSPATPHKEKLRSNTKGKYLSHISTSSRDTSVEFVAGPERTDVKGEPSLRALGEIKVANRLGNTVKHWELTYHYDLGRLGLKSVQELSGSEKLPPYRFEYYKGSLPSPLSYKQDHWGYYNSNSAQTLIPNTYAVRADGRFEFLDGANRAPDPSRLTAGLLRRILYPTGGIDTLDFEPHDYSHEQKHPLEVPVTVPRELRGAAPDGDTPAGQEHVESHPFTLTTLVELKLVASFSYGMRFGGGLNLPSVSIKSSDGTEAFRLAPGGSADENGDPTFKTEVVIFNPDKLKAPPSESTLPPASLPPGNYVFEVRCKKPPPNFGLNSVSAILKWDEPTGEKKILVRQGGGVRIARITRSFGFGVPDEVTTYQYKTIINGEAISSGSLLEASYKYAEWMKAIVNVDIIDNIPRGNRFEQRFFRYAQNRSALGTTQGSHVGYSQVTVIHGITGENGRTIHKFTSPINFPDSRWNEVPYPPTTSYDFKRGLALERIEYAAGSDTVVRHEINKYSYTSKEIVGIKVGWKVPQVGGSVEVTGPGHLDRYAVQPYTTIVGYARQIRKESHLHDGNHPFITEAAYEYQEGGHKQLTKESRSTNEGRYIAEYKYPNDYPINTDDGLDELVKLHVVNTVIEKVTYREDGLVISAQRNRYSLFNGKVHPSQVETAIIDEPFIAQASFFDAVASRYEPRHVFRSYDANGNILEQSEPEGMVTCYIWDSRGTQLLAKIDNASRKQVYYENFEDALGGTTTEQAYTGLRSKFVSGSYTIEPSHLQQLIPGDYTLSYCQKIGQKDWAKIEKRINYTTSGTSITTDPINGYVDEIRLHPTTAHMTTFSHEPLRGLITQSDINIIPTYYEYDEFGRLSTIRDQNRHITAHYKYIFPVSENDTPTHPGYVRSFTTLKSGLKSIEEILNADHRAVACSTDYVDGFARTIQKVNRRGSPNARDVVDIVAYDAFGRKAIKYLPFTVSNDNGDFVLPNLANQQLLAFYTSSDERVAKTRTPFSVTRYDGSPLDRVIEQGGPGEAWQPQENSAKSHTQRFEYRASTAEDKIFHWRIRTNEVYADSYYAAGELRVELTYDEHNTEHFVFYDREGHEILRQVQNPAPGTNGTALRTYFVYDSRGNLACVIPPATIAHLPSGEPSPNSPKTLSSETLRNECYRYKYDHRSRLVERGVPGTELVFQLYDRWDRLVLSQSGNQRVNQNWTYHKYDALDRLVISGEIKIPGGRRELVQAIDGFYSTDRAAIRRFEQGGRDHQGYTNRSFPILEGTASIDRVVYRDYYKFIPALPNPDTFRYKKELESCTALRRANGQITGQRLRILATDQYITKVIYYDKEYRPIQEISDNHLDGMSRHSQSYTFIGKPFQSLDVYEHQQEVTRVQQEHIYDHAQRLTRVYHQVNDQKRVILYAQTFNDLGQVINKSLYSSDGGITFAQQVDYRYNIRGWLTSINSLPLSDTAADKRLFALRQVYDGQSAKFNNVPRFDGNVSYVTWMNAHFREEQTYVYRYDVFDRLQSALYRQDGVKDGAYDLSGADEGKIRYDENGNILSLSRRGFIEGQPVAFDVLTYNYRANQLTRIEDASGRQESFNSGGFTGDAYEYDPNGNLIVARYKKIQIAYNHRNLVDRIVAANGDSLLFGYDATDRKHYRNVIASDGSTKLRHDYIGDAIFEQGALRQLMHDEGYLTRSAQGREWQYHYHLLDPQGNVRLVFRVDPALPGGESLYNPVVVLATDYYPYGLMLIGNQHYDASTSIVKHLFSNKEFQDDLNLGWYDFGARLFDPVLGRWNSVDLQADKYPQISPYSFVLNNPVRYVDPDGQSPWSWFRENVWIPGIDPLSELDVGRTAKVAGGIALAAASGGSSIPAQIAIGVIASDQVSSGILGSESLVYQGGAAICGGNSNCGTVLELGVTLGADIASLPRAGLKIGASARVQAADTSIGATSSRPSTSSGRSSHTARRVGTTRKSEYGTYTNTHDSRNTYSGMGGRKRSQVSGREKATKYKDPHISTDWTPAESESHQRFDEALRIYAGGGKNSTSNYNKVETGTSIDRELYEDFVNYILRPRK